LTLNFLRNGLFIASFNFKAGQWRIQLLPFALFWPTSKSHNCEFAHFVALFGHVKYPVANFQPFWPQMMSGTAASGAQTFLI